MSYHTPQAEAVIETINNLRVAVWWDEVNLSGLGQRGLHCSVEIGLAWNTIAFPTYIVGSLTSEAEARQEFGRMVDEINAAITEQVLGSWSDTVEPGDFDALIESLFSSVRFVNGQIIW